MEGDSDEEDTDSCDDDDEAAVRLHGREGLQLCLQKLY